MNQPDGLFDCFGLIESLKTLLGGVQVSGLNNLQRVLLAAQGLDVLAEGLKREKERSAEPEGESPALREEE